MIYINPYLSVPINTIIGGVAGSISTKSALAAKLGISESIITRFQIVGSDVHAHISSFYEVTTASVFTNNLNVTFYKDLNGFCTRFRSSAFSGATNLVDVYAPNAYLEQLCFFNCTKLETENYIYNPNAIDVNAFRNSRIKKFTAPNLTQLPNSVFHTCTALTAVYATLTQIGSFNFNNTPLLTYLDVSKVTNMGGDITFYLCGLENFYFDELLTLTGVNQTFRDAKFKIFKANKLVNLPSKDNMFQNTINATLIEMKSLKTFGDSSLISNTFTGIKTGCTIRVNIALATTNAGAADASLFWAKANRAAIVEFYDDAGNYVSTL